MEEISFGIVVILFVTLYILHLVTALSTEHVRPRPVPPPPTEGIAKLFRMRAPKIRL